MKRALVVVAAGLAAAVFQTGVYSQDAKKGEALAKQATCMNCHTLDTKKVGPAFKDSAKKYKGAGADKLVAQIKTVPAHAAAAKATKDDDLKAIAAWILSM